MRMRMTTAAIWAVGVGTLAASPAVAQPAGTDAEIAVLKQQLGLMEQKLDKLEKQSVANAKAAATANAKATKAAARPAYAAIPPKAPSDVVMTMPNNRPTFCTADGQN